MNGKDPLEALTGDGKMSAFKMAAMLIKFKAKLGNFRSFLKASKLIIPIANSMEDISPERIAKIERVLESAQKITENSATCFSLETEDMPLIVMETRLAPHERLALLEDALMNKEDLLKSFSFLAEEKYALIFVIKTENNVETKQVARDIISLLGKKFPDFSFCEDEVEGEISIVTTKDITVTPKNA